MLGSNGRRMKSCLLDYFISRKNRLIAFFLSLDDSMLAGHRKIGDFEDRLKFCLNDLLVTPLSQPFL